MFPVQSVLGFVFGFAAAAFILTLCAPFLWRRALFLAQKVVRTQLPLSLKEVEADRDFLRARHAVAVCRLEEALAKQRAEDHGRKLALSHTREKLSQTEALEAQCQRQQAALAAYAEKIAKLEERNQALKDKAQAALTLKQADLTQFRRQIKAIAAQTAGFIAAAEGAESPVLQLVTAEAAAGGAVPAKGAHKRGGKPAQAESLAAAIAEQAAQAAAAQRAKEEKQQAAARAAELAAQVISAAEENRAEQVKPAQKAAARRRQRPAAAKAAKPRRKTAAKPLPETLNADTRS